MPEMDFEGLTATDPIDRLRSTMTHRSGMEQPMSQIVESWFQRGYPIPSTPEYQPGQSIRSFLESQVEPAKDFSLGFAGTAGKVPPRAVTRVKSPGPLGVKTTSREQHEWAQSPAPHEPTDKVAET